MLDLLKLWTIVMCFINPRSFPSSIWRHIFQPSFIWYKISWANQLQSLINDSLCFVVQKCQKFWSNRAKKINGRFPQHNILLHIRCSHRKWQNHTINSLLLPSWCNYEYDHQHIWSSSNPLRRHNYTFISVHPNRVYNDLLSVQYCVFN